jgi:hypothetical protein
MHLTPVQRIVYIIALVLALTGLLSTLGVIAPLEPFAFWLAFVAWMLVTAGRLAEHV